MKRRSFLKTAAATALGMQIVPRHALGGPATARAGIPPQPIISRGVPAFASSGTASYANNAHYWNEGKWAPDTEWISYTSPAWLAYDLAGVPAPKRSKLLVIWYGGGSRYDYTIVAGATYRMPGPYLLEGSAAPGGGSRPPATGWVPLVTGDKPQVYHSRQHIVDFAGYNWLRFRYARGKTRSMSTAATLALRSNSTSTTPQAVSPMTGSCMATRLPKARSPPIASDR